MITFNTTLPEVAAKSLENFHVPGLHSLVLDSTPGKMIRMFYSSPDHELYRNMTSTVGEARFYDEMSLAFHSHHCDLKLVPVLGSFLNIITKVSPNKVSMDFGAYKWTSFIKTGRGKFEHTGNVSLVAPILNWYNPTNKTAGTANLAAYDIHTIYVPRGMCSAWLVYEGKEDPNYNSTNYSTTDLSNFNTDGLYQKMSETYAEFILNKCGIVLTKQESKT